MSLGGWRPKIGQKSVSSIIQVKTISLFSGSSWSSSFRCPCCSTFWTFCVWGSTFWSHLLAQALGVTKSEYVNSSLRLARFYVVQKCFIFLKRPSLIGRWLFQVAKVQAQVRKWNELNLNIPMCTARLDEHFGYYYFRLSFVPNLFISLI